MDFFQNNTFDDSEDESDDNNQVSPLMSDLDDGGEDNVDNCTISLQRQQCVAGYSVRQSVLDDSPARFLLAMGMGTGKTITAINMALQMLKQGLAKHILWVTKSGLISEMVAKSKKGVWNYGSQVYKCIGGLSDGDKGRILAALHLFTYHGFTKKWLQTSIGEPWTLTQQDGTIVSLDLSECVVVMDEIQNYRGMSSKLVLPFDSLPNAATMDEDSEDVGEVSSQLLSMDEINEKPNVLKPPNGHPVRFRVNQFTRRNRTFIGVTYERMTNAALMDAVQQSQKAILLSATPVMNGWQDLLNTINILHAEYIFDPNDPRQWRKYLSLDPPPTQEERRSGETDWSKNGNTILQGLAPLLANMVIGYYVDTDNDPKYPIKVDRGLQRVLMQPDEESLIRRVQNNEIDALIEITTAYRKHIDQSITAATQMMGTPALSPEEHNQIYQQLLQKNETINALERAIQRYEDNMSKPEEERVHLSLDAFIGLSRRLSINKNLGTFQDYILSSKQAAMIKQLKSGPLPALVFDAWNAVGVEGTSHYLAFENKDWVVGVLNSNFIGIYLTLENMQTVMDGLDELTKPEPDYTYKGKCTKANKSELKLIAKTEAYIEQIRREMDKLPAALDGSTMVKLVLPQSRVQELYNIKVISVVFFSPAFSEGISFKGTRQIHIMAATFNEQNIEQAVARGIRSFSHCHLPEAERKVDVFRWIAVADNNFQSADARSLEISQEKQIEVDSIQSMIVESDETNLMLQYENSDQIVCTPQKTVQDVIKDKRAFIWVNETETYNPNAVKSDYDGLDDSFDDALVQLRMSLNSGDTDETDLVFIDHSDSLDFDNDGFVWIDQTDDFNLYGNEEADNIESTSFELERSRSVDSDTSFDNTHHWFSRTGSLDSTVSTGSNTTPMSKDILKSISAFVENTGVVTRKL